MDTVERNLNHPQTSNTKEGCTTTTIQISRKHNVGEVNHESQPEGKREKLKLKEVSRGQSYHTGCRLII